MIRKLDLSTPEAARAAIDAIRDELRAFNEETQIGTLGPTERADLRALLEENFGVAPGAAPFVLRRLLES